MKLYKEKAEKFIDLFESVESVMEKKEGGGYLNEYNPLEPKHYFDFQENHEVIRLIESKIEEKEKNAPMLRLEGAPKSSSKEPKKTDEKNGPSPAFKILNTINKLESIKKMKDPLTIAVEGALIDAENLPEVKYFLCCGHSPKFDKKLIEKRALSFFDSEEDMKKPIRKVIKTAEIFSGFIQYCKQNNNALPVNSKAMRPEEMLYEVAKRDKVFFNELVRSLFENEWGERLNISLTIMNDTKKCILALIDFSKEHLRAFEPGTVEQIADYLNRIKYWSKAREFYEMALILSDDYAEISDKLCSVDKSIATSVPNFV